MHRLLLTAAAILALPAIAIAKTADPPPPLSLADAAAIAAELQTAQAQGINLPDVSVDVASLVDPNPAAHAVAEGNLIRAAIAFANAEHGMDLDPHAIDPNFHLRANYDATAEFNQARAQGQVAAWLDAQNRRDAAYVALVDARARYAALAASGWPEEIAAGPPLKVGMHDARVPALLQRLAAEGYAPTPPAPAATNAAASNAAPPPAAASDPEQYDTTLAAAVSDFQSHHALEATGVLDAATVTALNVSPKNRLATLDVNLERARWLPLTMPALRIEADVGGPEVTLFQDNKAALTMRAVAGAPRKQTPSFAAEVTAVVFNPPWYVPPDIARAEIFPHEARSPGYLARNDMIVSGGSVIQRAGPMSALGYVKFDLTDPYAVYLHDTPSRGAFASNDRWRSHGCVRLQMPRELAAAVLGWTPDQVQAAIAAKATKRVPLAAHIPVFILYRTAAVADDGKVDFRRDPYGWDLEVSAAMAGHPLHLRHQATVAGA